MNKLLLNNLFKKLSLQLLIAGFLASCSSATLDSSLAWQQVHGRNEKDSLERPCIYRAKVPASWKRIEQPQNDSLVDTRKSICEFLIEDPEGNVRLTLHNFPSDQLDQRIPASAQIQRWKGQFSYLNPASVSINSLSQGGFTGLFLEGEGILNDKPTAILAWSMQLAPDFYRSLQQDKSSLAKQKRADYTIKALGPPSVIAKYRSSIIGFATSFELIDELPPPL